MKSCSKQILDVNRLNRKGVTQLSRLIEKLLPKNTSIDERTEKEWLVFAQQLSEHIKFAGPSSWHSSTENWKLFFDGDVSTQLAIASVQNTSQLLNVVHANLKDLKRSTLNEAQLKSKFGELFGIIMSLAYYIDRYQMSLPESVPLKSLIQNLIREKLAVPFARFIAYYKAAVNSHLDDSTIPLLVLKIFSQSINSPKNLISSSCEFSRFFIPDNSADWNTYAGGIAADDSIFKLSEPTVKRQLYYASTHYAFTSVIDQFLKVYKRIIDESDRSFLMTLEEWSSHKPHTALFLAFLKLLMNIRCNINTLTKRHIDLYYKEILGLKPQSTQPGKVHVIYQLAKSVDTYLARKGALLKAGKDINGDPVYFSTTGNIEVNQAKIERLCSVYIDSQRDNQANVVGDNPYSGKIYASPVINSADGRGMKLVAPNLSWHPFANKVYQNGTLKEICMPDARIGFALATNYLYLTEGKRAIILTIEFFEFDPDIAKLYNQIEAEITTSKGWLPLMCKIEKGEKKNELVFKMVIEPEMDPTAPYDPKIHLHQFNTVDPILVVYLKQTAKSFAYDYLEDAIVSSIKLTVDVDRIRDLMIHSDFGPMDPSQAFLPFGANPQKGRSLIIGNKEVFQKETAKITPHIHWKFPSGFDVTKVAKAKFQLLRSGRWIPEKLDNVTNQVIFQEVPNSVKLSGKDVFKPRYIDHPTYTKLSTNGFMRYILSGHKGMNQGEYQKSLAEHLAKVAAKSSSTAPSLPFLPEIAEIYLSYNASKTFNITGAGKSNVKEKSNLFHSYPFGEMAIQTTSNLLTGQHSLFPRFRHKNEDDDYFIIKEADNSIPDWLDHQAEFYIGISELTLPATLSILFQHDEGSTNPDIAKPKMHVHWSYLGSHSWISFAKQEVVDSTIQLTRSGTIVFSIPHNASNNNPMMERGFFWLRASVSSSVESVARLLEVIPHAVLAERMANPLGELPAPYTVPKGTITKLVHPVPEVKKLGQPYPGFGGRKQEAENKFYQRVSERLRHRDRAVNIWDIEHLILQEFPNIYRVKAIPHTRFEQKESGLIYSELVPGHISVITIPDTSYQQSINPLKPTTSIGDLERISKYLKNRITCFATLHIANPIFEEVKVSAKVKLRPGYDESEFKKKLKSAVTHFLSPWASGDIDSLHFGNTIEGSAIINFIEEIHYVNYLKDFKLHFRPEKSSGFTVMDQIRPTRAVSVLVSVPAADHTIQIIDSVDSSGLNEYCTCNESGNNK